MTLLIDGKPEELARFLGLFVNDDDDIDDTDTDADTNDDDDNKRLAAELTEIVKRYPHLKKILDENGGIMFLQKS